MLDVTYVFSLFINEIRMHDALHIFLLFLSITPKFCLFFRSFFYKMSTDFTDPIPILTQKKNKGGRPLNSIWEDIQQGDSVGSGKFSASCKYCDVQWKRGEVLKLEEHLSNYCVKAPATVVRKYMTKVMERQDKASKKRKVSDGQQNIDNYHDYTVIPDSRITRINRALIKFFVACGISFRIVEHPFFINFVKELNAGYDLPTREYLAGQLLERELAQINSKVKSEIEKESNLTLGLLNYSI
jgi:hypothetical protein